MHMIFTYLYLPKHIESIQNRKFKPDNKTYREPEDIKINKTAKDAAIIEGIIPDLLVVLEAIYIKFESRNFYDAFLKNITPLSLLNTVNNELAKIQKDYFYIFSLLVCAKSTVSTCLLQQHQRR